MTEKKAKKLLHRIWFHYDQLQKALNAAHSAGLIEYKDYATEAPCEALWKCRERVEKTTKDQLAAVIQSEIRAKIK